MAISTKELISRINQELFSCEKEHPHQHLVKRALKGPYWSKVPDYDDCFLLYQVKRKNRESDYLRAIYG